MSDMNTVIIDNGSYCCKVGFGGDDSPRLTIDSIVGFSKYQTGLTRDYYFGQTVFDKYPVMNIIKPVDRGIIDDWGYMEKLLNFVFKQIPFDPVEHPILITETLLNPKYNREKMIELIFEEYHFPSFYTGKDAVFSLYSAGRNTGLSFESGAGVTTIVPVYEGNYIKYASKRIDIGGDDITKYLLSKIENPLIPLLKDNRIIIDEIKSKYLYVALNYDKELQNANLSSDCQVKIDLYKDIKLNLNTERFQCPELLFKPELNNIQNRGIEGMIPESILSCQKDIQKELFSNIILSGGNSLLNGLKERIEKSIHDQVPNHINVEINQNRENSAWKGGSIISTSPAFQNMLIYKNEYDECGSRIVNHKCI